MLFSNNCKSPDSLLRGSTVGYPSDSLVSCKFSFETTVILCDNKMLFRTKNEIQTNIICSALLPLREERSTAPSLLAANFSLLSSLTLTVTTSQCKSSTFRSNNNLQRFIWKTLLLNVICKHWQLFCHFQGEVFKSWYVRPSPSPSSHQRQRAVPMRFVYCGTTEWQRPAYT